MAHYLLKGVHCPHLLKYAWKHSYSCCATITDRHDMAAAVHRFKYCDYVSCRNLSIVLPDACTLQAFRSEYALRDCEINRLMCSVAFEDDLRAEAKSLFITHPDRGYKAHLINWKCSCTCMPQMLAIENIRRPIHKRVFYCGTQDSSSCSIYSDRSNSEESCSD